MNNKLMAGGNVIYPREQIIMTRAVEAKRGSILKDKQPIALLALERLTLSAVKPFEEIASTSMPQKLGRAMYKQILAQTVFATFVEKYPGMLNKLCSLPGPRVRAQTIAELNSCLDSKNFKKFMRAYGKIYGQNCHSTALYTSSPLLKFKPERVLKNCVDTDSSSPFASLNFLQMYALTKKLYPNEHKILRWKTGISNPKDIFINNAPHLIVMFDLCVDEKSRRIKHQDIHSLLAFKLYSAQRERKYYLAFEKSGLHVSPNTENGAVRFGNLSCSLNIYAQGCKNESVILSIALCD